MGDCTAAVDANRPASPPLTCPASPKGPLELALEQLDVASSVDDRTSGGVLPAAAVNGGAHAKDARRADDVV